MSNELRAYEGRAVVESTVHVASTLEVDPVEYHHGERVYLVLECAVSKVGYVPLKDQPDELRRVHALGVRGGSVVDELVVRDVLDERRRRLDAARGVLALELDDEGQ